MKLHNIYVSNADIDLIIQSVRSHAEQLIAHLECERTLTHSKTENFEEVQKQITDDDFAKKLKTFAPYGLKKNGTPSKRRGRPFKAKKVTA